jgi:hypothetical protein
MSWALLEMAPLSGAGFKVSHTPYSKLAVSLESAQQSIEGKRDEAVGLKKRFFHAKVTKRPGKQVLSGTRVAFLMKVNGSVANPDTANPPAITVPEALALHIAGRTIAGVGDIGRTTAVIAISRTIIAGPVITVL